MKKEERAAINKAIERMVFEHSDFEPYVEGMPGTFMTFPCLLDIGHEGPCAPINLRFPERRFLLDVTTCRRLLKIKDRAVNDEIVDDILSTAVPTSMSWGEMEPNDVLEEGPTVQFDQLLRNPDGSVFIGGDGKADPSLFKGGDS